MSRPTRSHPPSYFEAIYAENPDPWNFAASAYERGKYEATLDALTRASYRRAIEIGCSIGVFTAMLAPRCESLLAIDAAAAPLAEARRRCAAFPQVEIALMSVPGEFPEGAFDLVVVSEVLYYLARADVERLARRAVEALEPGGEIVLVHWTGPHALPQPLTGDEAADAFIEAARPRLAIARQERAPEYRLDLLRRKAEA